ncbi:MAG: glucose-1-phosphate adenylyltransferase [Anaerolineae bacterium]|jgi:glucose-1-phosphate adenylyltransferase|nr:glucose-1-phosphate adenylyltransferase [Anaerolineae bacterium]MDH7475200.1 glucose-1-phosphate adenylyltransferase [Anaerolineae bacterium]
MPLQDVLAVVLGGGRGTRLYPLTKIRAKPAVPVGSKYRLIDIPISNCINSGITRIFVLTQFLSASLHRHVYQTYKFDVFSGGFVEILPAEQTLNSIDWYQGTADAVRQQVHRFLSREPEDVLILAGDHLYRMDYGEFVRFHRESRADVTIAVLPVSAADAPRYGILQTNEEGRIVAFREKPQTLEELKGLESRHDDERPYLASMGIYVFRMDVLARLLNETSGDDFGRHIIPTAIESVRVYAFPFDGYWEDIGTIAAFYEANLALTRPHPPFDFYDPHRPIYTRARFLPPSRIDGCHLERTVVAEGCWLYDADIEECIIGLRSVVRPGARLRQVVMMGADYYEDESEKLENRRLGRPHVGVGKNARIERAIIDKNVRIGEGVIIRSHAGEPDQEGEYYVVRDGIVVIPKNAIIPNDTVI